LPVPVGRKIGCGEPGSIDPEARETKLEGSGKANVRRSRLQCSVPCMPVVSQAGNRVTWNHFLFGGGRHVSPTPFPLLQAVPAA
jgi:hypothetical protein